jgi:molecular chaperone GrpE
MKKSTTVDPKIEALTKEKQQFEEAYKRALADYQNLQRRVAKDQGQLVRLANATLISGLLPIIDQLETAANHLKDQGLDMILTAFKKVLEDSGVSELQVLNQTFDPHTMECVDKVPGPENIVVKIREKGYELNHQLLRPAKVEVGLGETGSATESAQ